MHDNHDEKTEQPSAERNTLDHSHSGSKKRFVQISGRGRMWLLLSWILIVALIAGLGVTSLIASFYRPLAVRNPQPIPEISVREQGFTVTDIEVPVITETTITVCWKTSSPASGIARAMEHPGGAVAAEENEGTPVTDHCLVLSGLEPDTAYTLRIESEPASGAMITRDLTELYVTRHAPRSIELAAGMQAPPFTLQSLSGDEVELVDFRGRTVLLAFWKISCTSCLDELPRMENFYRTMDREDLVLVTVSTDAPESLITSYMQSNNLTFPVLLDNEGETVHRYTIAVYPTSLLVDENGLISGIQQSSFSNVEEIHEFVERKASNNAA